MPGSAIVEVESGGVLHEYTTLEGLQEDVIEVLLNLEDNPDVNIVAWVDRASVDGYEVVEFSGVDTTTVYHEGVPGHHLQISLAQENQQLPAFRRILHSPAFTEGWALYAEKLAGEMGVYEGPQEEYGRLVQELWRAVRLVLDTGLHAKGWSRSYGNTADMVRDEGGDVDEARFVAGIRMWF
ncbi:MAG: hypothetical protein B7X58_09245, partial [Marinobacter sp. 34-60-7]